MQSIWTDTLHLPSFDRPTHDLKTDVLIIGGGLAGLLCAYMLRQAGVDYALIEAEKICSGTTANTTAKLTSQHGPVYHKLLRDFGTEAARMYWEANEAALGAYRSLCSEIDCDYEEKDSVVYGVHGPEILEKEKHALDQLRIPSDFESSLQLPFPTAGGICFHGQAQFNPLRFAAGIARDLRIFEHTAARAYDGRAIVTDHGRITAQKIIVATHFPFLNKHGGYFLKLYQHRSYVLALTDASPAGAMYIGDTDAGHSLRDSGRYLLLGGGAHRTGKRGGGFKALEGFARAHYPQAKEARRWATQDCMTLDGVPYVGQYAHSTPDLYVAAGFNKWGMTSSMAAAQLLCDLVQGKKNPYAALYDPSRTMLRPQLMINGFEAAKSLLTPTRPRCPHMGCALKWNTQERTWDCPCHGSRFSGEGELIDNPSTGNLRAVSPPPCAPSDSSESAELS